MNVIDIAIVLLILMFGIVGWKRGVFKQVVMTVGILLLFFLSFKLKDPLANLFCRILPFFNFGGNVEGVKVLNILLYHLLAFLIVFGILGAVLSLLIKVTGIFETILKFTIVLGIPSKILGFLVGLVEGYIVLFIALFFLRQPAFMGNLFTESRLTDRILNSTPVLTEFVGNINRTVNDIYDLSKQFSGKTETNQLNLEILDRMLKYKVVNKEEVQKLVEKGKLSGITGIDTVIKNY